MNEIDFTLKTLNKSPDVMEFVVSVGFADKEGGKGEAKMYSHKYAAGMSTTTHVTDSYLNDILGKVGVKNAVVLGISFLVINQGIGHLRSGARVDKNSLATYSYLEVVSKGALGSTPIISTNSKPR